MFVLTMMNCLWCRLLENALSQNMVLLKMRAINEHGKTSGKKYQPNSMPRLRQAMAGVGLMTASTKMEKMLARSHHGSAIIRMVKNHSLLPVASRNHTCLFLHLINILNCIHLRNSHCSRIHPNSGKVFQKQPSRNGMKHLGSNWVKKIPRFAVSTCRRITLASHFLMRN